MVVTEMCLGLVEIEDSKPGVDDLETEEVT